MKNKIINVSLVILVIVILSALAFIVRVRATTDTVAVLEVSGMTCGTCVDTIKNSLQEKRGIGIVAVDLNLGRAIVGYDSRKLEPDAISAGIASLGYPNRVVELTSLDTYRVKYGNINVSPVESPPCGCSSASN